jgi:hypothetical protein
LRSNREKKKPKAEKNKKKSAPVPSVFERVRTIGKDASGKKSGSSVRSIPRRKVRSDGLIGAFSLSFICRYGHRVYLVAGA